MKLIEANIRALDQARSIVNLLDEDPYMHAAPNTNGLRIGAHLRHVVEFYQCFLLGIVCGFIDYDARRRDPALETSRKACVQAIDDVIRRLRSLRATGVVLVRVEEAYLKSSVARELQAVLEHSIHHFALVAIALHAFGIGVDPTFGVAASTLRYRARSGAEAA